MLQFMTIFVIKPVLMQHDIPKSIGALYIDELTVTLIHKQGRVHMHKCFVHFMNL